MTEMNETLQTIARQIGWRELRMAKFKFCVIDDKTLRVNKNWKNFDIRLNSMDLYDIEMHTTNKKTLEVKTEKETGYYEDMLRDAIGKFFRFNYINLDRMNLTIRRVEG